MHILTVAVLTTFVFTVIVLFFNLFATSQNDNTLTTIAHIPAMLRENDNDDDKNNLKLTDHIHIDPIGAILTATKNVSAQPSDLRSIALETKNGYPVFSMDIYGSGSNHLIEVTVNAVNGKILRIDQDLDDDIHNMKKENMDESNEI